MILAIQITNPQGEEIFSMPFSIISLTELRDEVPQLSIPTQDDYVFTTEKDFNVSIGQLDESENVVTKLHFFSPEVTEIQAVKDGIINASIKNNLMMEQQRPVPS